MKVTTIRKYDCETTWKGIAKLIHSDQFNMWCQVGDKIEIELKDGQKVNAVVAHFNPYGENQVAFVLENCLDEYRQMNSEWTNEGGWPKCKLRENMNEGEIFALIPDDLKEVVTPRIIRQNKDGEVFESTDKFWVPSATELGFAEDYCGCDIDDVHFDLFKDNMSRQKTVDGYPDWYWTRSPWAANSSSFANVYTSGSVSYSNANSNIGVAFGFLI